MCRPPKDCLAPILTPNLKSTDHLTSLLENEAIDGNNSRTNRSNELAELAMTVDDAEQYSGGACLREEEEQHIELIRKPQRCNGLLEDLPFF